MSPEQRTPRSATTISRKHEFSRIPHEVRTGPRVLQYYKDRRNGSVRLPYEALHTQDGASIPPMVLRELYRNDSDRDKKWLDGLLETPWLYSHLPDTIRKSMEGALAKGALANPHLGLAFGFAEDELRWTGCKKDCMAMHAAFSALAGGKERATTEAHFKKVSVYNSLNGAIPRNAGHLPVTPQEHTRQVEQLGLINGFDNNLNICAQIVFKMHDWGKVVTALYDDRQHHHIISAEIFATYVHWVQENIAEVEQPFYTKEPYVTLIKAAIRMHDVLGLMGKGVFSEADLFDMVTRETATVDNSQLVQFNSSREQYHASVFAVLGALSAADALSVTGYERFGVFNAWVFIKLFEKEYSDEAKRELSHVIIEHARMIQRTDNSHHLLAAYETFIQRLSEMDESSMEYKNLHEFMSLHDTQALSVLRTLQSGTPEYKQALHNVAEAEMRQIKLYLTRLEERYVTQGAFHLVAEQTPYKEQSLPRAIAAD